MASLGSGDTQFVYPGTNIAIYRWLAQSDPNGFPTPMDCLLAQGNIFCIFAAAAWTGLITTGS